MRQQLLHGYVLHQRAYRERSQLVHFFSLEYGRVDGVARQGLPPLYQPCLLYASGKTSLKSFRQFEQAGGVYVLQGSALFAGFYLNELLVRLLPLEESCPELFARYGWALEQLLALQQAEPAQAKRQLWVTLRHFEAAVLDMLGLAPVFDHDADGLAIEATACYRYRAGVGFERQATGEQGVDLLAWGADAQQWSDATLAMLTRVYRQALAHALGDQPLRSRELWQSQAQIR